MQSLTPETKAALVGKLSLDAALEFLGPLEAVKHIEIWCAAREADEKLNAIDRAMYNAWLRELRPILEKAGARRGERVMDALKLCGGKLS